MMKKLFCILMSICLVCCLSGCLGKEIEVNFIAQGEVLNTVTGRKEIALKEYEPILESSVYHFYGWQDSNGNDVDLSVPVTESIDLYAKLVRLYTVKWVNEGEVLASQEYEDGDTLVLPEIDIPQSSQTHYVFLQWVDSNSNPLVEDMKVTSDLKFNATYQYTMERIDIEVNPLVFSSPSGWKRAGISDNLYGVEYLKITSSDESIAYYSDTHIIAVSAGECTFRIESKSGLIRYLTVIVNE